MSQDRIIAFDINAASLAQMQGSGPRPTPQDTAPKTGILRQRAENRARLAQAYAGLLGQELALGDLADAIVLTADQAGRMPQLEDVAGALQQAGFALRLMQSAAPEGVAWPALAELQNGQLVLVLGFTAAGVEIFDPEMPDLTAEVVMADFGPLFTGRVLSARPALNRRGAGDDSSATLRHWFWGEFRHFRRPFVEISAASLVANLLAVAVSLFSMQVYDRVIPYQSEPTLWVLALGAVLAVVLEAVLKIARAGLMDRSGKRLEAAVQDRLMARLLGMQIDPMTRKPSEVFTAMRDFGAVREFFTSATVGTLADLPFLLLFLALVASIGGPIVWVLVFGAVLMIVPGFLLQARMMAYGNLSQGAAIKSAKLLYETVFEQETIVSQRGEARVRRQWHALVALSAQASSAQRRLTTLLTSWSQAVQQACYIAAVVMGCYLVFAGQFSMGTIIAIGLLTGRVLGPLAQISGLMARWSQTKIALKALDQVALAKQVEVEGRRYLRRDRLQGSFEIRHLAFRYDPEASASVQIEGLAIPAGQSVAVLGANGSGKSTFLRLLAGIYQPNQGHVLLDGVDMAQIHPRDLRRSIGYLGQDVRLIAGSIRDNLNMRQLERDDDRLLSALDFAGLGPFLRQHPRGLDLEIRELGEGLSVGQRQSMGWARLWLQDPQVVLLDEPTAALDQTLEATLVSRLSGWLAGRTTVIATHRVPILQLTCRSLILQNGYLAVDGPKEAVLAHLAKAQMAGPK